MMNLPGNIPTSFPADSCSASPLPGRLLTDPKLLIADEPVSMVDASLRMSIVNLFKKLRDDLGVSVLYITHDLATAYYVSDRIAIMFRGNIVEMGTVEQVLTQPQASLHAPAARLDPPGRPQRTWTDTVTLSELEHDEYLRQGCKFAGRCPMVMERCKTQIPQDVIVEGVQVKCHLFENDGSSPPAS